MIKGLKPGVNYCFKVRSFRKYKKKKYYSRFSKAVKVSMAARGESTIKNFLKTAAAPVGTTLYIWGGGWNKADTGTGKDGKRIGLNGEWNRFSCRRIRGIIIKSTATAEEKAWTAQASSGGPCIISEIRYRAEAVMCGKQKTSLNCLPKKAGEHIKARVR